MNGRSCAVSTRVHSSSYGVPHPSLAPGTPVGTLHERREMIEVRAQPFNAISSSFPTSHVSMQQEQSHPDFEDLSVVARRPVGDEPCFICYQDILKPEQASWCRHCGHNSHIACETQWRIANFRAGRRYHCGYWYVQCNHQMQYIC